MIHQKQKLGKKPLKWGVAQQFWEYHWRIYNKTWVWWPNPKMQWMLMDTYKIYNFLGGSLVEMSPPKNVTAGTGVWMSPGSETARKKIMVPSGNQTWQWSTKNNKQQHWFPNRSALASGPSVHLPWCKRSRYSLAQRHVYVTALPSGRMEVKPQQRSVKYMGYSQTGSNPIIYQLYHSVEWLYWSMNIWGSSWWWNTWRITKKTMEQKRHSDLSVCWAL